jgi:hypothetical protein
VDVDLSVRRLLGREGRSRQVDFNACALQHYVKRCR